MARNRLAALARSPLPVALAALLAALQQGGVSQRPPPSEANDRGEPEAPPPDPDHDHRDTLNPTRTLAWFDCALFAPGAREGPSYIAALNRAFAVPGGVPNPQVGQWRCRPDAERPSGYACFSAGGAPLDLPKARSVTLLFQVLGPCATFAFSPRHDATSLGRGRWAVRLRQSDTLNFKIRTDRQNPDHHWGSFFKVNLRK